MRKPTDPQILRWREKRLKPLKKAKKERAILKEAIALFSGDTELAYRYLQNTRHPTGKFLIELLSTSPQGVAQVIKRDKKRLEKGRTILAV